MKESYFNCNKDSNNVVDNSKPSKKHNMPVLNEGSYFGSKLFDMCLLDEDTMQSIVMQLYKNAADIINSDPSKVAEANAIIKRADEFYSSLNPSEKTGTAAALRAQMGSFGADAKNILSQSAVGKHTTNGINVFNNGNRADYVGAGETATSGRPSAGATETSMWDSFKNALSGAWNHTADSFKNVFKFDGSATTGQYATVGAVIAAGALGTYWLWKKFKKNGKLTEQDYREADNIQKEAEQRKASGNYDANKQLAL